MLYQFFIFFIFYFFSSSIMSFFSLKFWFASSYSPKMKLIQNKKKSSDKNRNKNCSKNENKIHFEKWQYVIFSTFNFIYIIFLLLTTIFIIFRSLCIQFSILFSVYIFTEIIHPYFFVYLPSVDKNRNTDSGPILPFLPLLITSCTCAVLLVPCWWESGVLLFTSN